MPAVQPAQPSSSQLSSSSGASFFRRPGRSACTGCHNATAAKGPLTVYAAGSESYQVLMDSFPLTAGAVLQSSLALRLSSSSCGVPRNGPANQVPTVPPPRSRPGHGRPVRVLAALHAHTQYSVHGYTCQVPQRGAGFESRGIKGNATRPDRQPARQDQTRP